MLLTLGTCAKSDDIILLSRSSETKDQLPVTRRRPPSSLCLTAVVFIRYAILATCMKGYGGPVKGSNSFFFFLYWKTYKVYTCLAT